MKGYKDVVVVLYVARASSRRQRLYLFFGCVYTIRSQTLPDDHDHFPAHASRLIRD